MADHLETLRAAADRTGRTDLVYRLDKRGGQDVHVRLSRSGQGLGALVSDASGSAPLAIQAPLRGNPVILYFLEQDIAGMRQSTGGPPRHFRQRIRRALAQGPAISPVTVPFDGQRRQTDDRWRDTAQRHLLRACALSRHRRPDAGSGQPCADGRRRLHRLRAVRGLRANAFAGRIPRHPLQAQRCRPSRNGGFRVPFTIRHTASVCRMAPGRISSNACTMRSITRCSSPAMSPSWPNTTRNRPT